MENKSNIKGPPLVLPDTTNFYSIEFRTSLKYFTSSSNAFKWDKTNINSKTKKFLARNGFNSLFWSAILIDESIFDLIFELFEDNIKLIRDEEFETTFGIPLIKSADISLGQLVANYFLLFALPAKSCTQYLQEWVKLRLDTFYRMKDRLGTERPSFDSHPELFLATKRRFYVYKHLVPALTLYAIESSNKRTDVFKILFIQIKVAISYSGLQTFLLSWNYHKSNGSYLKVFDLQAIKDDITRISAARDAIIEKYGENSLPFARLFNYPEAEGLDRRHYPDLAFAAHHYAIKRSRGLSKNTWNNFTFRKIKTKTPTDELKRLAVSSVPFDIVMRSFQTDTVINEEYKELLANLSRIAEQALNRS